MKLAPTITVAMIKAEAKGRLDKTDWMVLRAMEGGAAVPASILRERAAIRARSNEIERLDPLPPDFKADWRWR
jgi:hypothetical protein